MFRYCLGLVTLCLVFVPDGVAAWGPGGCLPVGRPVAPVAVPVVTSAPAPTYRWSNGIDSTQVHLFHGDRQVGTYRRDDGLYYPFDGQSWGQPTTCPTDLPEGVNPRSKPCSCSLCGPDCRCERDGQCREAGPGDVITQNFGVDTTRLSGDSTPRYYLGNQEVKRESVVEALASPRMPDDASKVRLTVIGSPEATSRVLADLKAIPGAEALVVKAYQPTDWAVRPGFVTTGSPTIYLQAPDGRVLHRQDDYDGPAGLAEAIRKAKPDYKPEADPDLRKLIPALPFKLPTIDAKTILLVVLAGVGVYLYFRKAK